MSSAIQCTLDIATGLRHGVWGRYIQRGRYLCNDRAPSSIGFEVAIASAAAISKVAISNGHCIYLIHRFVKATRDFSVVTHVYFLFSTSGGALLDQKILNTHGTDTTLHTHAFTTSILISNTQTLYCSTWSYDSCFVNRCAKFFGCPNGVAATPPLLPPWAASFKNVYSCCNPFHGLSVTKLLLCFKARRFLVVVGSHAQPNMFNNSEEQNYVFINLKSMTAWLGYTYFARMFTTWIHLYLSLCLCEYFPISVQCNFVPQSMVYNVSGEDFLMNHLTSVTKFSVW